MIWSEDWLLKSMGRRKRRPIRGTEKEGKGC